MTVEIYTDGSAKNNGKQGNCGGFGLCVIDPDSGSSADARILYTYSKRYENTTNNRMELSAIIKALELSTSEYKDYLCIIKSDSAYCVNMINEWIYSWHSNGWKRTGNKEVENLDLVQKIWEYLKIDYPNFRIEKVPGHANIFGNEIADALSTNNIEKLAKILHTDDIFREF